MSYVYFLILVTSLSGDDYKAEQIDSYNIADQCVLAVDARRMYLEEQQALVCIRKPHVTISENRERISN